MNNIIDIICGKEIILCSIGLDRDQYTILDEGDHEDRTIVIDATAITKSAELMHCDFREKYREFSYYIAQKWKPKFSKTVKFVIPSRSLLEGASAGQRYPSYDTEI